jgi:hypothetical protein
LSKLYKAAISGLRAEGFTDDQISRELDISLETIAEYPGEASQGICGNCGTEHEAGAGQCQQCGRLFSALAQPFESGGPSIASWRASVARAAQTERSNESAVRRGGDVNVESTYLEDLKTALAGVEQP